MNTPSVRGSDNWTMRDSLVREATLGAHTAVGGVHTFSIVRDPANDRFFGYAGPLTDGPIDLWVSSNLIDWAPAAENPILAQPGLRWPSVYHEDDRFYLATRGEYFGDQSVGDRIGVRTNREIARRPSLFAADRIRRKLTTPRPTSISLYASDDGVSFDFEETFVEEYAHDNPFNQNPFLFPDPPSGGVGLVYYSGDNQDIFDIRCRVAETVGGLLDAPSRTLIRTDDLLAAPAVFYHPDRESYWLLAEAKADGPGSRRWIVVAYESASLTDGFEGATRRIVFENDVACPFPYVYEGDLYLFVSKRLRGGLLPRWEGRIYRTPL